MENLIVIGVVAAGGTVAGLVAFIAFIAAAFKAAAIQHAREGRHASTTANTVRTHPTAQARHQRTGAEPAA